MNGVNNYQIVCNGEITLLEGGIFQIKYFCYRNFQAVYIFCNNEFKFYFQVDAFSGYRVKRQDSDDEEEDTQKKICEEAGAEAGEWFRLQAGEDKCRDVVSCTASVRIIFILFCDVCLRKAMMRSI